MLHTMWKQFRNKYRIERLEQQVEVLQERLDECEEATTIARPHTDIGIAHIQALQAYLEEGFYEYDDFMKRIYNDIGLDVEERQPTEDELENIIKTWESTLSKYNVVFVGLHEEVILKSVLVDLELKIEHGDTGLSETQIESIYKLEDIISSFSKFENDIIVGKGVVPNTL